MTSCPRADEFAALVAEEIGPVLQPFDFGLGQADGHGVKFTNRRVWITVRYEPRDCEIAVLFGRMQKTEVVSYGLFVRKVAPETARRIGDAVVETDHDVLRLLRLFAASLVSDGRLILEGDERTIDAASNLRWWHFRPEALDRHGSAH